MQIGEDRCKQPVGLGVLRESDARIVRRLAREPDLDRAKRAAARHIDDRKLMLHALDVADRPQRADNPLEFAPLRCGR